ncbi:putative ABC-type phosphate transporter [Helianthus debilis subsp. tardiflorus]
MAYYTHRAIPAALTYYWHMKMPETACFTALVSHFLQDITQVLQGEIKAEEHKVAKIAYATRNSFGFVFERLHPSPRPSIAWIHFHLVLTRYCFLLKQRKPKPLSRYPVPFIFFIHRMDHFAIQLMGFFFMTIFMFVLAIPYHHWTKDENRIGFLLICSLIFFLANFGPSSTTFVVPAEIFSASLHSTCHGISAAAGKAAAIVGAYGFLYASESTYPKNQHQLSCRYWNKVHSHHFGCSICIRIVVYAFGHRA